MCVLNLVQLKRKSALLAVLLAIALIAVSADTASTQTTPPYPPSQVIESMTWEWETLLQAADGSDLWPVTWADDGHLYTAWGDGSGFGGDENSDRVAMGIARIEGPPESHQGFNINGGTNPEITTSFPESGKSAGILSVNGRIYSWVNTQNDDPPDIRLAWSDDRGATWEFSDWSFWSGDFAPATFLNFGKDYSGARDDYLYIYAGRWGDDSQGVYLLRVLPQQIEDQRAFEYYAGSDGKGNPIWGDVDAKQFVFEDPGSTEFNGGGKVQVIYNPGIGRYILTMWHGGPGSLGVFEGPEPWGPWSTVFYTDDFGGMTRGGEGLTSSFPTKWISDDGLTMWNVFSVWGDGAKQGIYGHDRFNLVKVTLTLKEGVPTSQPLQVDAGTDAVIQVSDAVFLEGKIADDGLPNPPGVLTVRWTKVSGPGPVKFADASAVNTTAIFTVGGTYVLRLTADDGQLSASNEVTVTIN
jgi:hypothetical protein